MFSDHCVFNLFFMHGLQCACCLYTRCGTPKCSTLLNNTVAVFVQFTRSVNPASAPNSRNCIFMFKFHKTPVRVVNLIQRSPLTEFYFAIISTLRLIYFCVTRQKIINLYTRLSIKPRMAFFIANTNFSLPKAHKFPRSIC